MSNSPRTIQDPLDKEYTIQFHRYATYSADRVQNVTWGAPYSAIHAYEVYELSYPPCTPGTLDLEFSWHLLLIFNRGGTGIVRPRDV